MYVEKAFLVECRVDFWGGGRNKKRGNPKVNEFDESISSMPDLDVNEVLMWGGFFIYHWSLGAFILPPFDS